MTNSISHRHCSGAGSICKINIVLFLKGKIDPKLIIAQTAEKTKCEKQRSMERMSQLFLSSAVFYASQDRHTGLS